VTPGSRRAPTAGRFRSPNSGPIGIPPAATGSPASTCLGRASDDGSAFLCASHLPVGWWSAANAPPRLADAPAGCVPSICPGGWSIPSIHPNLSHYDRIHGVRGRESFSGGDSPTVKTLKRKRLLTPFAMHVVAWVTGSGVVFVSGFVVARLAENDSRPLSSPDPVRHAFRWLALRGQESFSCRGLRCGGAEDRGRESFSGGDSPTVKTLKRKRLLTPFAMHVVAWVTGSGVVLETIRASRPHLLSFFLRLPTGPAPVEARFGNYPRVPSPSALFSLRLPTGSAPVEARFGNYPRVPSPSALTRTI
jgi:hypothetical protein